MNEKKQPKPVLARTPDYHTEQNNDDGTNGIPQAKNLKDKNVTLRSSLISI